MQYIRNVSRNIWKSSELIREHKIGLFNGFFVDFFPNLLFLSDTLKYLQFYTAIVKYFNVRQNEKNGTSNWLLSSFSQLSMKKFPVNKKSVVCSMEPLYQPSQKVLSLLSCGNGQLPHLLHIFWDLVQVLILLPTPGRPHLILGYYVILISQWIIKRKIQSNLAIFKKY